MRRAFDWPSKGGEKELPIRRRIAILIAMAVSTTVVIVGQAGAAVDIQGHPLDVFTGTVSDSTGPGGLQARFDGETNGQFADPTQNATAAGLHIAILSGAPPGVYGPSDAAFSSNGPFVETTGPDPVVGTGTESDPFDLHSRYTAAGALTVDQNLFYRTGDVAFRAHYTVTNTSGGPITFRPTLTAGLFLSGGNPGYGVFVPGPPRLVSGVNDIVGDGGAIQESAASPFLHYEEADAPAIWAAVAGPGFNDTVNPGLVNPGIGIQWTDTPLAPGAFTTFEGVFILGGFDGIVLSPGSALAVPGNAVTVSAAVRNHSRAVPGKVVHYSITGANPTSGTATTDSSGLAQITWTGNNVGVDTVNAYVDSNGNGVRDAGEVLRTATVNWRLPKPVFGKTGNLTPVNGNVVVTAPRGGLGVVIHGPRQIRIGSTVNVTKGVAHLVTSRSPQGGTQAGNFFGGTFKLQQKKKHKRGHRPPTTLMLKGGKTVTCRVQGKKATVARRVRKRHLWGNAHGHYRSVGQNSAAEVRGTKWEVSDTCAGTLTVVRRGVVLVTDFVKHKTVVVKKGHSYLARFR